MSDARDRLPPRYLELVNAYDDSGRMAYVRYSRKTGKITVSLNGHKDMSVPEAMDAIEAALERESNPIGLHRQVKRRKRSKLEQVLHDRYEYHRERNGINESIALAAQDLNVSENVAREELGFKPRESNPIRRVPGGWKWGKHGHVYPNREGAVRQAEAAHANGFREKNPARDPIVYEHGDFYVTRNRKGHFEIWKQGVTAATRVSYIGYEGQKGLDRVKSEIERREREHNPSDSSRSSEIAGTILKQLGGHKFLTMTGARDLVYGDDMLQFRLPRGAKMRINRVRIYLNPDDLYRVEFFRMTRDGLNVIRVAEFSGIYADQLQETFTRVTGLDTHL